MIALSSSLPVPYLLPWSSLSFNKPIESFPCTGNIPFHHLQSIFCNINFSWGAYWVRDTDDVRELFTRLTDALEILVKVGIEGDTTINFQSSVWDISVIYSNQQNNISEQNYYSSVNLDSNFNLSFIWWILLYIEFVNNFSFW